MFTISGEQPFLVPCYTSSFIVGLIALVLPFLCPLLLHVCRDSCHFLLLWKRFIFVGCFIYPSPFFLTIDWFLSLMYCFWTPQFPFLRFLLFCLSSTFLSDPVLIPIIDVLFKDISVSFPECWSVSMSDLYVFKGRTQWLKILRFMENGGEQF